MKCPKCHIEIDSDARFCPNCREKLTGMARSASVSGNIPDSEPNQEKNNSGEGYWSSTLASIRKGGRPMQVAKDEAGQYVGDDSSLRVFKASESQVGTKSPFDVFICYHRKTGADDARLLQQALKTRGYNVFFDYDSLRDRKFDTKIFEVIDEAPIFILMLTEGSLDNCIHEDDPVRMEIEYALNLHRKIVPIVPMPSSWSFPDNLPGKLCPIKDEQISKLNKTSFFEESVDRIIRDRFPSELQMRKTPKEVERMCDYYMEIEKEILHLETKCLKMTSEKVDGIYDNWIHTMIIDPSPVSSVSSTMMERVLLTMGRQKLFVLGKKSVKMGRSEQMNDLVVQIPSIPQDDKNTNKTVSRCHGVMTIADEYINYKDTSSFGSQISGQGGWFINEDRQLPTDNMTELRMGNIKFHVTSCHCERKTNDETCRGCQMTTGNVSSVILKYVYDIPESYLIVPYCCDLGSVLPSANGWTIFRKDGGFAIRTPDQQLHKLYQGTSLAYGGQTMEVKEFKQLIINNKTINNILNNETHVLGNELNQVLPQKVYSSVYAPAEIAKNSNMLIQVYLHSFEEIQKAMAMALEVQKDAVRRDQVPITLLLTPGDEIEVSLDIYGSSLIETQKKRIVWQGSISKCTFRYFVPTNIDVNDLSCEIKLTVKGIPVGEMFFCTKIVEKPQNDPTVFYPRQFNKVFISYAHEDASRIQFLAKGFKMMGIDYFFDRDYLKAGDIFPEEIRNYINTSDLFILCWSENASKSEYVHKELSQALKLAYPNIKPREKAHLAIRPYSIEPRTELPEEMKDIYNFEDI